MTIILQTIILCALPVRKKKRILAKNHIVLNARDRRRLPPRRVYGACTTAIVSATAGLSLTPTVSLLSIIFVLFRLIVSVVPAAGADGSRPHRISTVFEHGSSGYSSRICSGSILVLTPRHPMSSTRKST